jgi:hypothetical protein
LQSIIYTLPEISRRFRGENSRTATMMLHLKTKKRPIPSTVRNMLNHFNGCPHLLPAVPDLVYDTPFETLSDENRRKLRERAENALMMSIKPEVILTPIRIRAFADNIVPNFEANPIIAAGCGKNDVCDYGAPNKQMTKLGFTVSKTIKRGSSYDSNYQNGSRFRSEIQLEPELGRSWSGHDDVACSDESVSRQKYFHVTWYTKASSLDSISRIGTRLISLKLCHPCGFVVLQGANLYQEQRNPEILDVHQHRILTELHYHLTTSIPFWQMEYWFPLDWRFVQQVRRRLIHDLNKATEIFLRARREFK